MIIKSKEKSYLVIPIEEIFDEIDKLETEIIVRGYKKESELYKIGMIRINQLNQILHKYSF